MSEEKARARYSADGSITVKTADGLQNVVTGMGTARDSRAADQFVFSGQYNNWLELEAAYVENWIAREVVDAPVDDATREWREFMLSDESVDIYAAEEDVGIQKIVQQAFKWAGLYGGAGIVMLIKGQSLDRPLNIDRIKKGDLIGLRLFDRTYLMPDVVDTVNVMSNGYMMPEYYRINGGMQRIHHSNIVRVPGARMPMRLRGMNGWWDDSRLRRCLSDLKDVVSSKSGIAKLIQTANVDIIRKGGLNAILSTSDQDESTAKRYSLFNFMKSCFGIGLLDDSEEYSRNQIGFGGLGDILRAMMEWCAGAAGIPMTRLFGVQAKGLGNDTSGDLDNYYNAIRSAQNSEYKDVINQLDQVFIRHVLGYMPDDYRWQWRPLQQMDPTELATRQKILAEKDEIRIGHGVPESCILEKLKADGEYPIPDSVIEQARKDEEADRKGQAAGRAAPEVEAELEED